MYLVSVIIPVYGVERYLDRCIESVVKQTYTNLEIILVDDGSPDSCPLLCDLWASKDSRIKVIHKKNGGLSSARNAALDLCSGDYIAFIDSDDWVSDTYIEDFLAFADLDTIVCCGYAVTNGSYFVRKFSSKVVSLNREQVFHFFLGDGPKYCKDLQKSCVYTAAWNKLYPKDTFEILRFPEGKNYEDYYLIVDIIRQKKNFIVVNKCNYYYYQRDDSIMSTHTKKNQMDNLDSKLKFEQDMSSENSALQRRAANRTVLCALNLLGYEAMGEFRLEPEERNYVESIIKSRYPTGINISREFGARFYIKYLFMQHCSILYKMLMEIKIILRKIRY